MSNSHSMALPLATLAAAALALAGCGADAPLAPLGPPAPDAANAPHAADAARSAPHARAPVHPGGGTVVYRAEMRVDDPPAGPFVLIHAMLEFQPGDWFPAHTHGGPALYTLVDGSVTVNDGGSETEYFAGDSYTHDPGQVLAAGNFGTSPSTMAVAFVLPEGEELITFHPSDGEHPGMPFPDITHVLATEPLTRAAPFSVVQRVVDLEPGGWTTAGSHPGPSLVTVLAGEVVLHRPGGEEEVVSAGQGWALTGREPAKVRATGNTASRLVATYVVPRGEVLGGRGGR
jgi:quercetin dioxygenase-like cupin family protein